MGDGWALQSGLSLAMVVIGLLAWRFSPSRSARRHFEAGRGDTVLGMLSLLPAETSAPFAVALGRYREALELLAPSKHKLDDEERVVACDALRMLGRNEEALEHFDFHRAP